MLEKFGKFIFCIVLVWTGLLAGIEINKFEYWLMWSLVVFGFLVGIGVCYWLNLYKSFDYEYVKDLEKRVWVAEAQVSDAHEIITMWRGGVVAEFGRHPFGYDKDVKVPEAEDVAETLEDKLFREQLRLFSRVMRDGGTINQNGLIMAGENFSIKDPFQYIHFIEKKYDGLFNLCLELAEDVGDVEVLEQLKDFELGV